MRPVYLHCHQYGGFWVVQFLLPDLKTSVGKMKQYRNLDSVREIMRRGNASAQAFIDFDRDIKRWGVGSAWLSLDEGQWKRLKG
jgi:hypothetical protein